MPFNPPAAPVLSLLSTGASSGIASEFAQDPIFVASFELALDAGSTPEWFTTLPTAVQQCLKTYAVFDSATTTESSEAVSTITATSTVGTSEEMDAAKSQSTSGPSVPPGSTSNSLAPTSSNFTGTLDSTTIGLSAGAKIGIGIGVPLATLLMLLLAILLWRVERRRKIDTVQPQSVNRKRRRKGLLYLQRKAELDAEVQTRNEVAAERELEGEARHELGVEIAQVGPVDSNVRELWSGECARELETSRGSHSFSAGDEKVGPVASLS